MQAYGTISRAATTTVAAPWTGRRRLWLASPVAALAFAAACPPHEYDLLAWVVPAVLLVSARHLRPARAAWYGLLFGTVWGCTMAGWMRHASLAYFGFHEAFAYGFVLVVSLAYAGVPNALLAAAYARLAPGFSPATRGIVGAWLWAASELLRTHVFTGLPWELLGHTQFRRLHLIQVADLGGTIAVSFVVAFVSVSLGELLLELRRAPRPTATLLRRLAPVSGVLLATLAYGQWCIAIQARPAGAATTVAVVQGNIANTIRWNREFFERTLLVYAGLTGEVSNAEPALVVWPENAVNFYIEREPMLYPVLASAAATTRQGLVVGGPRLDEEGRSYNSAYLLAPNGQVLGTYDKRHLLPFAEYNPLRAVEAPPLGGPLVFTPGPEAGLLRTAGLRLGMLICYEVLFPDLLRDIVGDGADLLINISNDAWLDDGRGAAPAQHFSMVVFSAVASRRYLVRAAASGISGFVSPSGAVYSALERSARGAAVGQVYARDGLTPYMRWGDAWIWVGGLLLAAALAGPRNRGRT